MDETMYKGCNFFGGSYNGEPLNDGDQPIELGNGNVAFPEGWTKEQAAAWRRSNNVSGKDWAPLN